MSLVYSRHLKPQDRAQIMRTGNAINKYNREITRAEALSVAWELARAEAGPSMPPEPQSLSQYVRRAGGIRPTGDARYLPLSLKRCTGRSLDEMASAAEQHGYQTDSDPHKLWDMLVDETFGMLHFSVHDHDILAERLDWQSWIDERDSPWAVPF